MKNIKMLPLTGSFAENKDVARDIRVNKILPSLKNEEEIILDFNGIDSATQSFIHALISDIIRKFGLESLNKISFKGCNETVRKIISIVVDYIQESMY